ncbi:MAG TPA: hypothetical protein VN327_14185 [Pseudonocardiaceae bacterium]|jgi:hypothetical protein|nr:hypothetical protein [Pseudonocardiaceae bacterium]
MTDMSSGGARANPTGAGVAWTQVRDAAVSAVRRGWPVVPGTCRPDEMGFPEVGPVDDTWDLAPVTDPEHAEETWTRRHRRARPGWWASLLQRTASETITVWQLARCLEREAAWAEKEKCQRALALRRQRQLSLQRVAVPITRGPVPYPGSTRTGAR